MKDRNIITAIGFAFREFAEETIRSLGIDPLENGLFRGMERIWTEEELTFQMGEEHFQEFLEEFESFYAEKNV